MDFIESILGGDRGGNFDFADLIKMFSRWIFGCGCLLLVGILVAGWWVVSQGEDTFTVLMVVITMLVAVASLIRTSAGY